jgi:hypothetical protein
MKRQLTALGVAAGMLGGIAAARADDVHWAVSIGVGGGGPGIAFRMGHLPPVVAIPLACPPPVRVVAPPPVIAVPRPVIVAPPCPPPRPVVMAHRRYWRPPAIVVPPGHYWHAGWTHRHGHR